MFKFILFFIIVLFQNVLCSSYDTIGVCYSKFNMRIERRVEKQKYRSYNNYYAFYQKLYYNDELIGESKCGGIATDGNPMEYFIDGGIDYYQFFSKDDREKVYLPIENCLLKYYFDNFGDDDLKEMNKIILNELDERINKIKQDIDRYNKYNRKLKEKNLDWYNREVIYLKTLYVFREDFLNDNIKKSVYSKYNYTLRIDKNILEDMCYSLRKKSKIDDVLFKTLSNIDALFENKFYGKIKRGIYLSNEVELDNKNIFIAYRYLLGMTSITKNNDLRLLEQKESRKINDFLKENNILK